MCVPSPDAPRGPVGAFRAKAGGCVFKMCCWITTLCRGFPSMLYSEVINGPVINPLLIELRGVPNSYPIHKIHLPTGQKPRAKRKRIRLMSIICQYSELIHQIHSTYCICAAKMTLYYSCISSDADVYSVVIHFKSNTSSLVLATTLTTLQSGECIAWATPL